MYRMITVTVALTVIKDQLTRSKCRRRFQKKEKKNEHDSELSQSLSSRRLNQTESFGFSLTQRSDILCTLLKKAHRR